MANVKITDLTAYTDAASTDVLPVVDVTNDVTKKISIANLLKAAPQGSAAAPGIAFDGDPDTGVFSAGANQIGLATNGSGRLFVDVSGNVGVNTSPSSLGSSVTTLEIKGGSTARSGGLRVSSSDSSVKGAFYIYDGAGVLGTESATPLDLYTGNSPRLRITSAGLVGIGTSSPGQALDVAGIVRTLNDSPGNGFVIKRTGGVNANGGIDFVGSDDVADASIKMATDVANALTLHTAGSERLRITSAGLVGIGTTGPASVLDVVTATSGDTAPIKFTRGGAGGSPGYLYSDGGGAGIYNGGLANAGIYMVSNDHIDFRVNGNERVRIDSSGRLLVGLSSGSDNNALLKVQGNVGGSTGSGWIDIRRGLSTPGSGSQLGILSFSDSSGNNYASIDCYTDAATGTNDYPGRLVFNTTADGASSPTERMRIKNNGTIQLGNGTLGLTGTLVIDPASVGMGYPMTINNPVSGSTNEVVIDIYRQGVRTGYITNTNTVTSYTSTSDYRLKENILPVTDGIARLKQLKPSRFNFIIEPEIIVDGFLAHEVQAVVPEAITGEKDEVDSNGNPVYQGIDQSKLVPLLTAALQEAVAKIESLEARLTAAGI